MTSALVIDKIEDVFEQVTDALLNDRNEISITLKSRKPANRSKADIEGDESDVLCRTKQISFPGKTEDEAWRFGTHPPDSGRMDGFL